jgi:hypothetical protein
MVIIGLICVGIVLLIGLTFGVGIHGAATPRIRERQAPFRAAARQFYPTQ